MIRVKFLKAHFKFAYSAGDVGYVTPDWAVKLANEGFAFPLPDDGAGDVAVAASVPAKVNGLPADLPGRAKLFENGLDTVEKIGEAGDDGLLELGLSKGTVTKIRKYLK
jgi:hypothetical protein